MTAEANPARVHVMQSEGDQTAHLKGWLEQLVSQGGSDLLLVPNSPAAVRVEGALAVIGDRPLSGEDIEAAVFPALAAHAREEYQRSGIADSSYRIEGLGRFRINLHRERGRAAATVRSLPSKVPALEELRLPPGVAGLAAAAARAGNHWRSDWIGENDDSRRAGKRDQSERCAPHRDD